MSFSFNGTRARLFGTSDIKNRTGVIDPSWNCFADQKSVGAASPSPYLQNNWLLCDWVDLPDGRHVVTVNATGTEKNFWVDRIHYIPSPSVNLESATLMVDRRDPNISTGSGWEPLGNIGIMTRRTGASLTFKFEGSRVTWVGTVPSELPRTASSATYAIDDQEPVRFTLNGLSSTSATEFNHVYFQTDPVERGTHSLVVTYEGSQTSTPLVLGNFIVEGAASTPTPLPKPSKAPFVGAIVGAVLGGLALLVLAALAFIYVRRRMRLKDGSYKPVLLEEPFHYIRPFTLATPHDPYEPQPSIRTTRSHAHSSSSSSHNQYITPYPFTAPSAALSSQSHAPSNPAVIRPPPPPEPVLSSKQRKLAQMASSSSIQSTPRPPASSQSHSSHSRTHSAATANSSRVVVHQDSGVRLPGSTPEEIQTPIIEQPPKYTFG